MSADTAETEVEKPKDGERERGVEDCLSELSGMLGVLSGIAWAHEGNDRSAALMFWGLHRLCEAISEDLRRALKAKRW